MIGTKPKNDEAAGGFRLPSGLTRHAIGNLIFAPLWAP